MYNNENTLIYNIDKIKKLFFTNKIVELDQIVYELNNIFDGKVSFDIEHVEKNIFKYTLLTPIKKVCMYFSADKIDEINQKADECFISLVKKYFAAISEKSQKEQTIATTTVPEEESKTEKILQSVEKEQSAMQNSNNLNDSNLQITQEQIDFIKKFIQDNKVDTDEKFNGYISDWNLTAKTSVTNKSDLAHAGRNIIDSFIAFVKQAIEAEQQETNFVTPSSEQVGCLW